MNTFKFLTKVEMNLNSQKEDTNKSKIEQSMNHN